MQLLDGQYLLQILIFLKIIGKKIPMDGWISTLNLSVMAKIWKRFRAPPENTTVSTRPALHHSSPGTHIAPVDRVEKNTQILDPDQISTAVHRRHVRSDLSRSKYTRSSLHEIGKDIKYW